MAYITSNEYKQIIYSGDARHKLKIWFNGNELVNADNYCEKIIRYPRILPKDGSKRFSLDNFISQQITIILHDINVNDIQDQVEISIGTLISENNYEYVPLGIFNIQGNPKTDKNKITITLRDNRTKFDFGYNAKPLIDAGGGKATKKQVLNDICEKAGVISDVTSFLGENDDIGIYDNSITGTIYVSYIAEQAGRIPIIKRNGHLDFINLKELTIVKIPLYLVEKYEIGDNYSIQRVVYESGIIKYETSNDETLDTLFINSANPYIQSQEHINNILQNVNGFEIDSVKTGEIMGDPAIDPYDLIQVYGYYDENNHFINDENVVVFTTLANHTMTYTGKIINVYDTQIGLEERKNNVTISGEATYRKYAKSEYDNVNASLGIMSGQINDQNEQIALIRVQYNEILSKISDIADITTSGESNVANVTLREVNTSQPIDIKIHPISDYIAYDYPHNDYPQNDYSKVRILRFNNITSGEIFNWILPTDLWYYDSENYDELELSYGDGTNSNVTVTRKCQINADNTTSLLQNPITETYPYPSDLVLSEGDYNVTLIGYTSGYLFVQLMAKNIYTTQFYTKAETNSIIDQTTSSINLSVDTKLSNYSTTQEMNSAITVKANEITSTVSETYATKSETNTLSSRISQTATGISLSVNNGQTSSGITIGIVKEDGTTETKSGTIQMSGLVSFSNLSTSGQTQINGANITTGKISAERLELSNYLTVTSASNTYASKSSLSAGTTTISGGCITTGTIDANKVTVKNINASNISSGTIDASTITVKNIDASKITTGTINGNVINVTNLNASNIKSGNIQSANYVSGSSGTKISLSDGSIDTRNFKVSSSGNITATGGAIGGWEILSNRIRSTNKKTGMSSSTYSGDPVFWAGATDPWEDSDWSAHIPFYVTNAGYLKATNASISGNINATSGSFTGSVTATSGSFTGSLYSSNGEIGTWGITSSGLRNSSSNGTVNFTARYLSAIDSYGNSYNIDWISLIRNSSDKNAKKEIIDIDDKFEKFYDNLKPKTYYYKDSVENNGKLRFGFVAQDILNNIKNNNYESVAMVNKNEYDTFYSLDKREIIALNTWQIQKLKKQVKELTEKLEGLING